MGICQTLSYMKSAQGFFFRYLGSIQINKEINGDVNHMIHVVNGGVFQALFMIERYTQT